MHPLTILGNALSSGAISSEHSKAGIALCNLAQTDPEAAQAFASKPRSAMDRLQMALRAEGASLSAALTMAKMMGAPDPLASLLAVYGG